MKLLITLYYNAELGGLQDNVFATAIEARDRGYTVFVACRKGAFNDSLVRNGVNTITIDQDKKIDSINKIIEAMGTDIDLIHAHPGNSRIIAMRIHRKYNIPVIYHVHGSWLDGVERYIDEVECVFAVSEAVRQKVINVSNGFEEKVHVIPNYSEYINNRIIQHQSDQRIISLIGRLDEDKKLIIEEFDKLIPYLNNLQLPLKINIIGDGTLKDKFMKKLKKNIVNQAIKVEFIGWVQDKERLKEFMTESTLIIGAGRVAIDSLTLNRPVIVVGAKNYQGIINSYNWQSFISNNFGEVKKFSSNSDIIEDIDILLNNKETYDNSIKIGREIINIFFDKQKILDKHFSIYNIVNNYN